MGALEKFGDVVFIDRNNSRASVKARRELEEKARQGISIILTSSELPELLTVCDRILVLAEGRLTAEFSRAEASEQAIMEAATKLATSS